MPSEKEFSRMIPKMYRNNYEKLALFFFIRGQLRIYPTMQLKTAIENFRRETGITEEEWDTNCMRSCYTVITREFIDLKYNDAIAKKTNGSSKT